MKKNSNNELNFSKLIKAANGDKVFINEMLKLFVDRTPGMITKMMNACKKNDFEKTLRLAHQLKPSVDMIGNLQMQYVLMEIHTLTRENSHCLNSLELIDEFMVLTEKTIELIKVELNSE
jgi:HPt (histidine-containing phosphotransfer) domain-containing protein